MEYTVEDLRGVLRDTDSVVFTDVQLEVYRAQFPDSIWRAAAFAINSLAIEYAAQGKSIKTDDLSVNLSTRGKDLVEVAKSFSDQADLADEGASADFFDIAAFAGRTPGTGVRPEATPWPLPYSNLHPGFGEGGFGH